MRMNGPSTPVIADLNNMAYADDESTTRILRMPFLETLEHDEQSITSLLLNIAYQNALPQLLSSSRLEGGITDGQLATVALVDIELQNSEAAVALNRLVWLQDGIDASEQDGGPLHRERRDGVGCALPRPALQELGARRALTRRIRCDRTPHIYRHFTPMTRQVRP